MMPTYARQQSLNQGLVLKRQRGARMTQSQDDDHPDI